MFLSEGHNNALGPLIVSRDLHKITNTQWGISTTDHLEKLVGPDRAFEGQFRGSPSQKSSIPNSGYKTRVVSIAISQSQFQVLL